MTEQKLMMWQSRINGVYKTFLNEQALTPDKVSAAALLLAELEDEINYHKVALAKAAMRYQIC